uniref:Uncharacterized protein n=1 Tax=Pseudonaja textilis TaxID=8673 RepID=A0A670XRS8_PSETE
MLTSALVGHFVSGKLPPLLLSLLPVLSRHLKQCCGVWHSHAWPARAPPCNWSRVETLGFRRSCRHLPFALGGKANSFKNDALLLVQQRLPCLRRQPNPMWGGESPGAAAQDRSTPGKASSPEPQQVSASAQCPCCCSIWSCWRIWRWGWAGRGVERMGSFGLSLPDPPAREAVLPSPHLPVRRWVGAITASGTWEGSQARIGPALSLGRWAHTHGSLSRLCPACTALA